MGGPGGRGNIFQVGCDIKKGLVNGEGFDFGRIFFENFHDPAGYITVALLTRPHKTGLRAESPGPGTAHGRVDAKTAGLIRTGCNHPAAVGIAADNNRPAAQIRVVELLDRGKKGIHVNMNNFPLRHDPLIPVGMEFDIFRLQVHSTLF